MEIKEAEKIARKRNFNIIEIYGNGKIVGFKQNDSTMYYIGFYRGKDMQSKIGHYCVTDTKILRDESYV